MRALALYVALSFLLLVNQTANSETDNSANVLPPMGHTYFCMKYPADCQRTSQGPLLPEPLSQRFSQLSTVNASVNAQISPKSGPAELEKDWEIDPKQGDCVGYAVTKRHALLAAGWPSSDLLLAEVTLTSTGEHHLILIVKGTKANWVLDNLRDQVVRLAEIRDEYVWDRIESSSDPKRWTKSFAGLG
jgi:predicted transglutaminase-like cysteine proteinase